MVRKNNIKIRKNLYGSGYGMDILKKLGMELTPLASELLKPITSAVGQKISSFLHPSEQKKEGSGYKLAGQGYKLAGQKTGGSVFLAGQKKVFLPPKRRAEIL